MQNNDKAEKKVNPDDATQAVIDGFHHRMRALRTLANYQLTHAKENYERDVQELKRRREQAIAIAISGTADFNQLTHCQNELSDCKKALEVYGSVSHDSVLAEVLLIAVFSGFDAFLNHLLRNLYNRRPELLADREEKQVQLKEVLSRTREAIIESAIDGELNSLLRESYSKIFEKLATRFDLKTLKAFDNWPRFIECSQRRHLITHCDGIVSAQYAKVCETEGAVLDSVILGSRLGVSQDYLLNAIETVTEVGLKLGQVLWRTTNEQAIDAADVHLGNLMFELLKQEEWALALRMGEFGRDLAKRNHKRPRKEVVTKVIVINYAQAAKWIGKKQEAFAIVDEFDWTGSAPEFRLSVACLKEKWVEAASLMVQVGANSTLVPAHGYRSWPIFREFRTTAEFRDCYKTMFGVEFATDLSKEKPSLDSLDANQLPPPMEDKDNASGHDSNLGE